MKSDVKVDYLELDGRTDMFIDNKKKREKAGNMGTDVTRWEMSSGSYLCWEVWSSVES